MVATEAAYASRNLALPVPSRRCLQVRSIAAYRSFKMGYRQPFLRSEIYWRWLPFGCNDGVFHPLKK
jgi:hypothetical protein